jgi:hypothetical protein
MTATPLLSTLLLALSLYAASLSFLAITRLQSWEATSERAAAVSNAAASQLRRTRTTQGAAAGAVCPFFSSPQLCLSALVFTPGSWGEGMFADTCECCRSFCRRPRRCTSSCSVRAASWGVC